MCAVSLLAAHPYELVDVPVITYMLSKMNCACLLAMQLAPCVVCHARVLSACVVSPVVVFVAVCGAVTVGEFIVASMLCGGSDYFPPAAGLRLDQGGLELLIKALR